MTLDYLIIGAGPAGLQLAALFEAEGRHDYLVLEALDAFSHLHGPDVP